MNTPGAEKRHEPGLPLVIDLTEDGPCDSEQAPRSEESSYICSMCGKSVPTYQRFIQHEHHHSAHDGLYSCPLCKRWFNNLYNFRKHERSHTDEEREKPYRCLECGRTFSQSSSLSRHKKIHAAQRPLQPT